jgi:hypothetical protein
MGEDKLPNLLAALATIVCDDRIPTQTWRSIDKELTDKLLRAAASAIRPVGTTRYESLIPTKRPRT